MRRFAQLFQQLDASTATGDKLAALQSYFSSAPAADAAWALYFLAGGKPRQTVPTALLRQLACQRAGIADWLFEACYQAAGDLAETIAQVLPPATQANDLALSHWVEQRLLPLRGQAAEAQATQVLQAWDELDTAGRFLLTKLIGGGFRVGVSKGLVQRALAQAFGLPAPLLAQRLMGYTDARARPSAAAYQALLLPPGQGVADGGQPYPFFLAHPLADEPGALGPVADWQAEWKYDGIRAQLVRRGGALNGLWLWSRGEELITERFPEVVAAAQALPAGTVLDGELLVWPAGAPRPAPFSQLQQRTTRQTLPKKLLAQTPVVFVAYDLLEWQGQDQRQQPLHRRRGLLEAALAAAPGLRLAPLLAATDWPDLAAQRAQARAQGVEGLMLKHRQATYGLGRSKAAGASSAWWKWKLAPLTADAVLLYAQAGHGRRAGLYTDYSFAVWNRPPRDAAEAQAVVDAIARREPPQPGGLQLLTFAKAYSGLTDEEFVQVDQLIRAHTLEKFGPVRSVKPSLVVELGFEGIAPSPRHKSGLALRFPRMLRLRFDKPLHEADSVVGLWGLVQAGVQPLPPHAGQDASAG